ncbi:hypothetical protein E2C01_090181 [Portunus trituberculatus]|uniref:Uncharacterized protein n=1 Tax=Portunus trituberculatus TaxID=210409 RepID=A0A5B7JJK2_PORTR|nr:hypothetical protein [Portunus trituberculatus]
MSVSHHHQATATHDKHLSIHHYHNQQQQQQQQQQKNHHHQNHKHHHIYQHDHHHHHYSLLTTTINHIFAKPSFYPPFYTSHLCLPPSLPTRPAAPRLPGAHATHHSARPPPLSLPAAEFRDDKSCRGFAGIQVKRCVEWSWTWIKKTRRRYHGAATH